MLSSDGSDASSSDSEASTYTCQACGALVEDEPGLEVQWCGLNGEPFCESCYDEYASSYGGTKYCCGNIYEEGESVCASCGDPL